MKKQSKFYTLTRKKILVTLVLLLVIASVLLVLEKQNVINLYSRNAGTEDDTAKTTSTTKTAQDSYTEGDERAAGNTLNENQGTGGITDNDGATNGDIDKSNPIISKTGEITLYSPKSSGSVKSGQTVSGSSTLPTVSYRLIDSISGVIAMGQLNVVNGSFSGNLNFSTTANEGRLDIYATKIDGTEFSNIEVPLSFGQP